MLPNNFKYYKSCISWCVNSTWIKCPISTHETTVQNDVWQTFYSFFFEEPNKSVSSLNMIYHYISSITVSSSNRHQVYTDWLLSRHVLLGHFVYFLTLKCNYHFMLCKIPEDSRSQTCSISVCPYDRKMPNVWI